MNTWKVIGLSLLLLIFIPSLARANGVFSTAEGVIVLAAQIAALTCITIGRCRERSPLDWIAISVIGWFLYPWVPYAVAKVSRVTGMS